MEIKNNNYSIFTILINNLDLKELQEEFLTTINKAPNFFNNNAFIVDFKNINFNFPEDKQFLIALLEFFKQNKLYLLGAVNISDINKEWFSEMNIPVIGNQKLDKSFVKKQPPYIYEKGSLRSGQEKYIKDNSIVFEGDIKNDAELRADNDIIILGNLNGKALAGFKGNKDAKIIVFNFQPLLVSIAGIYKMYEKPDEYFGSSVIITLNNNTLNFKKL